MDGGRGCNEAYKAQPAGRLGICHQAWSQEVCWATSSTKSFRLGASWWGRELKLKDVSLDSGQILELGREGKGKLTFQLLLRPHETASVEDLTESR